VDTPLSVSRLEALLESAQLLHSSLELDDLLKHLLRSVMGRLVVPRGFVAVEEEGSMHLALVRGFKDLKAGDLFDADAARAAGATHVVPIGDGERPLGLIGLGTPAAGRVDPDEHEFLLALSGIAASGIANARAHDQVQQLNRRLDHKIHELQTLLELVRALSEANEPDEVAHLLGLTLAGQWAVGRYAVAASKSGHPTVVRQKGARLTWQASWAALLRTAPDGAVFVDDLPEGDLRAALQAERFAILFPVRSTADMFGFAALGPRPGNRPYGETDRELGAGLVAQSVVAFENAWHLRELLEKKQIERELALAASIQRNLFPARLPVLDRFDIAAANRPARQVGGDYYDAILVDPAAPNSLCLFCVADVSGKGIAASLLMSSIQATLRALLGREVSLGELARRTNELLYANTPGNKYVTAILMSVEPATGRCRYVNGGHTEALVMRADGTVERYPATGVALGLFSGVDYQEQEFALAPGDLVALYSDGVTEALNLFDEEFGLDRLIDSLTRLAGEPVAAMLDAILRDVDRFVGEAPQYDDITLLLVRRRAA
jgi:sigma-B regulation protein RsbU (phosphoserine phosphatase)